MAKLWKMLPIMLSIVVAAIAVVDVSCSGNNVRNESITITAPHLQELDDDVLYSNGHENSYNAPVAKTRGLFSRNWKLIGLCSLGFLLVVNLLGAMVLNSNKNSNVVKVLGEKAERGKLAMQTSSNYTMSQLQNITERLTTPIPVVPQVPGLIVKNNSFVIEVEKPSDKIEKVTTEISAVTNVTPVEITLGPHDDCVPVGKAVYKLVETILPQFRKSLYKFRKGEEKIARYIKEELKPVIEEYCGDGFFEMRRQNGKDVLFFDDKNKIVKSVIKDFRCSRVARDVIPVLARHQEVLMSGFSYYHVQQSTKMKENMMNAIDFSLRNGCGWDFLQYGVYGHIVVTIHATKHPTIATARKKRRNAPKCQIAANAIVYILNQRNARTDKLYAKNTIPDSDELRDTILNAYNTVRDWDCEDGFIEVEENEDNVVVKYKTTNPFTSKSWAEVNNVVVCENIASDVLNYLLDLNLFTRDRGAKFTIPDENENIRTLIEKLKLNRQFSCGNGFFTHSDDGERFQLSYNRGNRHVDTFWKQLPQEKVCKLVADRIIPFLIEKGFASNNIKPLFTLKDNGVGAQIRKWIYLMDRSVCGEGFPFSGLNGYRYTVGFDTRNKYIPSTWMENSARIICPKAAAAVVAFLEPLDAYTTLNEAQNTYYHCDVDENDLATKVNSTSNLNCGNGFFRITEFPTKVRVNYVTSNAYIRAAWKPLLHEMECRQVAEEVAWVIDDKGRIYRSGNADETFHRWKYSLVALDRVGKLVENKKCGNGYFTFIKGLMFDNFQYHGSNKYVKAAWKKLERDRVCAPAAREIVSILHRMRLHDDLRQENQVPAFVHGELDRLTEATNSAKKVNCDANFATLVWDDGAVTIDYEMSNKYMSRAWAEAFGEVPRNS